jgi:hypothetical protein
LFGNQKTLYIQIHLNPSGIRNFPLPLTSQLFPSNGHYYQYILNPGITWTNAKQRQNHCTYYGLQGYLTLSIDEAKLSGEQAAGAGWIGGSDKTEGVWKWVPSDRGIWNGAVTVLLQAFAME